MLSLNHLCWLVVGGSAGTLSRFYLSHWVNTQWGIAFPYGTLVVNVSGCLVIGLLLGLFEGRFASLVETPLALRLALMTGFLGAFTTFSTYEMEAFAFLRVGAWEKACLYLGGSI